MFKVYFTNFQYYSQEIGATLDEALAIGKKAGFEFSVNHNNQLVAAWSPLSGTRYIPGVYELTDGQEITATRLMTLKQAEEANEKASQHTDGNWYWKLNPEL